MLFVCAAGLDAQVRRQVGEGRGLRRSCDEAEKETVHTQVDHKHSDTDAPTHATRSIDRLKLC